MTNSFDLLPEENPAFYNLSFKKGLGVDKHLEKFRQFIKDKGLELLSPLQYDDPTIKSFVTPAVFLVREGKSYFKVRVCDSDQESARIIKNINYARSRDIPVSKVVCASGPLVFLEYTPGETIKNLSSRDRIKIADIHNQLNHTIPLKLDLRSKLIRLIGDSIYVLKDFDIGRYKELCQELPNVLPVFDHQDFGLNNLIRTPEGFSLVDEEALGILPWGFSVYKAMEGKRGFNICCNSQDVQEYLSCFPKDKSDYYHKTHQFFGSLYTLRESARVLIGGNKNLARKLIENGK